MSTDHLRDISYPAIIIVDINDRSVLGVHDLSIGLLRPSGVPGVFGVVGGFRVGDGRPIGVYEANALPASHELIPFFNSRFKCLPVDRTAKAQIEM